MYTRTILTGVFAFLFSLATTAYASPASDLLVSEGRALLSNGGSPTYSGLIAANEKFRQAVLADPLSSSANFFYGVTRIPASFFLAGPNPSKVDSFKELFEIYGCTRIADAPFGEFPYALPQVGDSVVLPNSAPSTETIRGFLTGQFITDIDNVIANFNTVAQDFRTFLPPSETGMDDTVEVDYGDVLIFRTFFLAIKTACQLAGAYHLDVDLKTLIDLWETGLFHPQRDLFDAYPDFLKLLPSGGISVNGKALIEQAKQTFLATIDSYLAGSSSIRDEVDSQVDDLITFDIDDLADEAHVRALLMEAKESLVQGRVAAFESGDGLEIQHVDLNHVFGTASIEPIGIRGILPKFTQDLSMIAGTFPDPTMDHVLVDCTTEPELAEFLPRDLPIVFYIARKNIAMDGNENDWADIPKITSSYFERESAGIDYVRIARNSEYLYWMLKLKPGQPSITYCNMQLSGELETGRASVQARIDLGWTPDRWYTVSTWYSLSGNYTYTGFTASDYAIGNVLEGRIPLNLVPAFIGSLGISIYLGNSQTGYFASLNDSVILTTEMPDNDGDGIPDEIEKMTGTDPNDADSDNDGIMDGIEDANRNGVFELGETDPRKADTDRDGIADGVEDANHNGVKNAGETDPRMADTEGDGMPDGWEVQYGLNPLVNDALGDKDGDGHTNLQEYRLGTNPTDPASKPRPGLPWLPLLVFD